MELLKLDYLAIGRKISSLSGGEKQRTAMGRALAVEPEVLCLDEPLSTLDDDTHEDVIKLIKQVTRENRVTSLHITHRKSEAALLGDHFFELCEGRIIQHEEQFA